MIDHDRLFKELLTTFFVEFLELFLPEVAAYIERESLEFLDKELFTDVTAGERYETDLIVKAKFREQESFSSNIAIRSSTNADNFRICRYLSALEC
jgi:hypothetical protein